MLRDLILRLGEPWDEVHEQDFGLESAERVADFFNNDGLEYRDENGENIAVSYAAVREGGRVEVGLWHWGEDEDFDEDAQFCEYSEGELSEEDRRRIAERIKEIYGTE